MLKKLIIILVLAIFVLASNGSENDDLREKLIRRKFENHLRRHRIKYDKLTEEVRVRRRNNYMKNLELIEKHNKDPQNKFKLGSNEYSDRDPERFVEETCRTHLPPLTRALPLPPAVFPTSTPARAEVDWRSQYTQPVVNQGACGSCWAFAAVAVIEAYNEIRNKSVIAMSTQNLLDCDGSSTGCIGGWPKTGLDFLKNSYGNKLATDENYPYTSGSTKAEGICKTNMSYIPVNYTSTFQNYFNGDAAALKKVISNYGPVAIAVQVQSNGLFQNYKSGIFSDPSCPGPNQCLIANHAMVAVGYGKTATGEEYFIMRNSYGASWGESGYIRMAMGNTCNIACWAMGVE